MRALAGAAAVACLCVCVVGSPRLHAAASRVSPPPITSKLVVDDPSFMPLRDVQAGMRGRSVTVFSSLGGYEEFEFVVLGVMTSALGPGEDLIIARLEGKNIEHTGVIAGMSGSPAYIDGKLIGAIGYRFGEFTREPIAGITPIERMMASASTSSRTATSPARSTSAQARSVDAGAAQPIGTPVVVGGVAPHIVAAFDAEFRKRGLVAVMGASSTAGAAAAGNSTAPERFRAGGPIAGVLVDGDMSMAAIGTVTWVKGDRFLAFGHPFLGVGALDIPAANADIVTTVASEAGSWKMGEATAIAGRLTDDRLHAIAGVIGPGPTMIPLRVNVETQGPRVAADARPDARFRIARHPTDAPLYCAVSVANAISARIGAERGGTIDVAVHAKLTDGTDVTLPFRYADETAGMELPAAFAVLGALGSLVDSEFVKAELADVDVRVVGRSEVARERVVQARARGPAHAGGSVDVDVRLQAFHGAVVERRVPLSIPRGLAPGSYTVVVASADSAMRIELEGGLLSVPTTRAAQVAQLLGEPPPGSLSAYLVRDEPTPRVGGTTAAGLPSSLQQWLGGAGGPIGAGSVDVRASRIGRIVLPSVVVGEASFKLQVVQENP